MIKISSMVICHSFIMCIYHNNCLFRLEDEHCPQQELLTPLPSTSTALTQPQPTATDSQAITLTLTSADLALLHPNAWAENFCLPWEKLNAKLRLAVSKGERPEGTDRRHLVQVVGNYIQENVQK